MTEFLMITLIALLMIISPGPDFAVVIKNSLAYGRSAGMWTAFGVACANACHMAINLLGLGIIIAKSAVFFSALKIASALYLMYLGGKGLFKKSTLAPVSHVPATVQKGFYSGLFTSILNPKVFLFYLTFFSAILSAQTPFMMEVFYGVWISGLAALWFSLVAIFFTSSLMGNRITQFKIWLERFTGGILLLLGLKLFMNEFNNNSVIFRKII